MIDLTARELLDTIKQSWMATRAQFKEAHPEQWRINNIAPTDTARLTADEMSRRIRQSLKENSAEFVRKHRANRNARIRQIAVMALIFLAGIAVGVLLMTAL